MRHLLLRILILATMALPTAGLCRDFRVPHAKPQSNGYVRMVTDSTPKNGRRFHTETKTWFHGDRRFRVESLMTLEGSKSADMPIYQVQDDKSTYFAIIRKNRARTQWFVAPKEWGVSQDAFRQPDWELREARLIGRETVHGLSTEHWRGTGASVTRPVRDIWISTDPRFPMVLRAESRSERGTYSFRVTDLKLMDRVPGHIFTTQVHPRPGLLAMLTLPHRTPVATLGWYATVMLAYLGAMCSIAPRALSRSRIRRVTLGVVSVTLMVLLLRWPALPDAYLHSLSGTPVLLLRLLLTALAIRLMIRLLERPGDVSFMEGTTAFSLLFVMAAAVIGIANRSAAFSELWDFVGLKSVATGFLAVPFLNMLLFAASVSAVEELVFRGYLLQALQARLGRAWLALLLQAVTFGVYHLPALLASSQSGGRMVIDLLVLTLYGLAFGALRMRYRNLGLPWLVHLALYMGILYTSYSSLAGIIGALGSGQ